MRLVVYPIIYKVLYTPGLTHRPLEDTPAPPPTVRKGLLFFVGVKGEEWDIFPGYVGKIIETSEDMNGQGFKLRAPNFWKCLCQFSRLTVLNCFLNIQETSLTIEFSVSQNGLAFPIFLKFLKWFSAWWTLRPSTAQDCRNVWSTNQKWTSTSFPNDNSRCQMCQGLNSLCWGWSSHL